VFIVVIAGLLFLLDRNAPSRETSSSVTTSANN
jgi:hypothetical protein